MYTMTAYFVDPGKYYTHDITQQLVNQPLFSKYQFDKGFKSITSIFDKKN